MSVENTHHAETEPLASWLRECNCGMRVANNANGNRVLMNHIANNN